MIPKDDFGLTHPQVWTLFIVLKKVIKLVIINITWLPWNLEMENHSTTRFFHVQFIFNPSKLGSSTGLVWKGHFQTIPQLISRGTRGSNALGHATPPSKMHIAPSRAHTLENQIAWLCSFFLLICGDWGVTAPVVRIVEGNQRSNILTVDWATFKNLALDRNEYATGLIRLYGEDIWGVLPHQKPWSNYNLLRTRSWVFKSGNTGSNRKSMYSIETAIGKAKWHFGSRVEDQMDIR